MNFVFKNATVYQSGSFFQKDISIINGTFIADCNFLPDDAFFMDCSGIYCFPGFEDVHVHLREPGFFYKESIASGTAAAAHGGYTAVCAMPNLNPAPDSPKHLKIQTELIEKSAHVRVTPYGTVTVGEKGDVLSAMAAMAPFVCGFSDDGHGVQNEEMMLAAMRQAKRLDKVIAAHCEDNTLLHGGYIHDGSYAREHGHKGICSESEWGQIKRDIQLVQQTGCAYHVCHISTKESVELIRKAKREGLDITCETAPHYLTLCEEDLLEDGRFKMNPPLRSRADREALIEGILDGTIDMIATDHAPHSAEEKNKGLKDSLMGIVGLETAFPVLYTDLVKPGILPLERLIALMSDNPRKRFRLKGDNPADLTLFDLREEYTIDPNTFLSKGRSTPFEGKRVFGKCLMTLVGGNVKWKA